MLCSGWVILNLYWSKFRGACHPVSKLWFKLHLSPREHLEADYAEETASGYRKHIYQFTDIDVILLEGIYLLKRQFQSTYDLSFWIECSFETALSRAIAHRRATS